MTDFDSRCQILKNKKFFPNLYQLTDVIQYQIKYQDQAKAFVSHGDDNEYDEVLTHSSAKSDLRCEL